MDWLSIDQIMYCAAAEGKCKVQMFDSVIQKLILKFTLHICIYGTICNALTGGRTVDYAS